MQVYKPLELGLLAKPFRFEGRDRWSAGVMLAFPLTGGEVLLEQDLWKAVANALGKDAILDACMPKPRGEVLVAGSYHAPGDSEVAADRVLVEAGSVKKELAVFGNRYWQMGVASSPEPMRSMQLTWENAFGGEGFERNPLGKGMKEVDVFGEMRRPLPNVENPRKVIEGSGQRPDPAGMSPIDMMWPQRAPKAGTYDERWVREIAPGLAEDIDWEFFNVAPQDQWIDGFFAGGEKYRIVNMHPDRPELAGNLPKYRVRCFIERKTREDDFHEIALRAETLWLLPGENAGILIYRGTANIDSDDGSDISHVLLAYENAADAPRDSAHYKAGMQGRQDPDTQLKYAVNTRDLIPETARCGFARLVAENPSPANIRQEHAANRLEDVRADVDALLATEREKLKQQLEAAGIDPAPHLAKFDQPEDTVDPALKALLDELERIVPSGGNPAADGFDKFDLGNLEKLRGKFAEFAEVQQQNVREQVAMLAETLKDVEGENAAAARETLADPGLLSPPSPFPRPPGREQVEHLRGQLAALEKERDNLRSLGVAEDLLPEMPEIDIGALERQLVEAGEMFRNGYRQGAHMVDGAAPLGVPGEARVNALLERLAAGGAACDMENGDFAGVVLAGRVLGGANLENAYLEEADLARADLAGANLRGAILPRANLAGANLAGANLEGANLGGADLTGADLRDANLVNVTLSAANLAGADLTGARMAGAVLLETRLERTNFTRVALPGLILMGMDMRGARFIDADLANCAFVEVTAGGADFSGANLEKTTFIKFDGTDAAFMKARLENTRFISECVLSGARFDGATGRLASFRGTRLAHASFAGAHLPQSDFSTATACNAVLDAGDFSRAFFSDADFSNASFKAANLMEAAARKTRFVSADMSRANCFSIDFTGATFGGTVFDGANLERTVLQDWRPS